MIKLNETWAVDADPLNYIMIKFGIASKGASKGQVTKTNVAYPHDMNQVIEYIAEHRIKCVMDEVTTMKELDKHVREQIALMQNEFSKAMEDILAHKRIDGGNE